LTSILVEPIQWATLPDIDEVPPFSDKDAQVLAELRAVLEAHGYADRFGVCLLHRHFELADDECLMESTDTEARVSTLTVAKRTDAPDRMPTMWRFGPEVRADTVCKVFCEMAGHVRVHRPVAV
jgi:hypothetical protein